MNPHPASEPLDHLRQQIDHVDQALLDLLRQRMHLAQQIGSVKAQLGIAPLQPERWQQVQTSRLALAEQHGLPAPLVQRLMVVLHQYSLAQQHSRS